MIPLNHIFRLGSRHSSSKMRTVTSAVGDTVNISGTSKGKGAGSSVVSFPLPPQEICAAKSQESHDVSPAIINHGQEKCPLPEISPELRVVYKVFVVLQYPPC